MRVGAVDLAAVARDRDQIWAEAVHMEAQGASITLPEELWDTAAEATNDRMLDDPWVDILSSAKGHIKGGTERISTRDLLGEQYLNVSVTQQHGYMVKRLKRIMNTLGWTGPKKARVRGEPTRCYERVNDKEDSADF